MNILILTGGKSERMGRDKATIERPDGTRQIDHIIALARQFSSDVFLSARDQNDRDTGLPVITDLEPEGGPTAALAAAAASGRSGPWLVIGCDLFLLDAATLAYLIAHHDPARGATAFRNRLDGQPEPLCAIYEESSIKATAGAPRCARKFLSSLDPLLLDLPNPAALDNSNTPADLAEDFQKLTRGVEPKAVNLLYFAVLREARGTSAESIETLAWTAAGLYEELRFRHRLPLDTDQLRVARNGEFSAWDAPVQSGDEFVFIPPRRWRLTTMFTISTDPIESAAVLAQVEDPTCGGLVVFEGRVRNHHRGRDVLRLEYEAYQSLAEAEGSRLVAAALERFPIHAAVCAHRTGVLEIGDIAVIVAVSAAHRDEAFDACRYIIDELKLTVPIWKREFYADGTHEWTGCDHCAKHAH